MFTLFQRFGINSGRNTFNILDQNFQMTFMYEFYNGKESLKQRSIALIDQMIKWLLVLLREWASCQYEDHGPPCKMFQ